MKPTHIKVAPKLILRNNLFSKNKNKLKGLNKQNNKNSNS